MILEILVFAVSSILIVDSAKSFLTIKIILRLSILRFLCFARIHFPHRRFCAVLFEHDIKLCLWTMSGLYFGLRSRILIYNLSSRSISKNTNLAIWIIRNIFLQVRELTNLAILNGKQGPPLPLAFLGCKSWMFVVFDKCVLV